jgi:hypothetical protein
MTVGTKMSAWDSHLLLLFTLKYLQLKRLARQSRKASQHKLTCIIRASFTDVLLIIIMYIFNCFYFILIILCFHVLLFFHFSKCPEMHNPARSTLQYYS